MDETPSLLLLLLLHAWSVLKTCCLVQLLDLLHMMFSRFAAMFERTHCRATLAQIIFTCVQHMLPIDLLYTTCPLSAVMFEHTIAPRLHKSRSPNQGRGVLYERRCDMGDGRVTVEAL